MREKEARERTVRGEFTRLGGEPFYCIREVDRLPPFLTTVVSDSDHWMYISSRGGLTAGRVSPDTALFPYHPVDRVNESDPHTGSTTCLRVSRNGTTHTWEPFRKRGGQTHTVHRHLYKHYLGNQLAFEEVNETIGLRFVYRWAMSDAFGLVRECTLENLGDEAVSVELIDGLQNLLPANTPRLTQTNASNLVDAYKWTELDEGTGLAMYTLYSGITDRPQPSESLKANTVVCLGLDSPEILLSSVQLEAFREAGESGDPAQARQSIQTETSRRGIRGAYLVHTTLKLDPGQSREWRFVANLQQSQKQVIDLLQKLADPQGLQNEITESVRKGNDALARIMASADGFQSTAEPPVSLHHYANVLFNVLRGGIFADQYQISTADFTSTLKHFNRQLHRSHAAWLKSLPSRINAVAFREAVEEKGDEQLARLANEYLPITFGRRHGDPSRPWNQFSIVLKDAQGRPVLSYQGNWRDIFQNWEALTFSYPEFIDSVIAKFVNASTIDGYNPYRITKQGIDWEVEEPDDPWSYIGYWGDHQIIYLLKLLELSHAFYPQRLGKRLGASQFSYANVPYRIKPFDALLKDAKNTVDYDHELGHRIETLEAEMGADARLVLDASGQVWQVNLLEKLLVPLLSKLGNLVVDGGIWLNTQRPEWNDANNALVGQGLSMVTLNYLRRYVDFMSGLLREAPESSYSLSAEVVEWLSQTAAVLKDLQGSLGKGRLDDETRYAFVCRLGQASSDYRQQVYRQSGFSGRRSCDLSMVQDLLAHAQTAIDHSIRQSQRNDRLYHAYNLLSLGDGSAAVEYLYPMLEGQVAALSSGLLDAAETVEVLTALFDSPMYRADQHTFLLYPDREATPFLDKGRIPQGAVEKQPWLLGLVDSGDERVVLRDARGDYRFNAQLSNVDDLNRALDQIASEQGERKEPEAQRQQVLALYEEVFKHQAFTGRSNGMFGFEGLGCIYWHMIGKLLLAAQENFFRAVDRGEEASLRKQIGDLYYRVREGIGFNKTPVEFGAFPTDPYSHTPGHSGAQQPGMTGQVKEEVLTRFGELGIRVREGRVHFEPMLLRSQEFREQSDSLRYLDVNGTWQTLEVPAQALAFTWCQVPCLYRLVEGKTVKVSVVRDQAMAQSQGEVQEGRSDAAAGASLSERDSEAIFQRSGAVRQITLEIGRDALFG